jgi:type IV pilus assembly protein PilY1
MKKRSNQMKKIMVLALAVMVLSLIAMGLPLVNAFAHDTDIYTASGQGVEPNILVIFDNSNSMADQIQVSGFYDPSKTYSGPGTSGAVYYLFYGYWYWFASSINQVACSNARTALSTTGFYSGPTSSGCNSQNYSLRTGNYINYLINPPADVKYQTKLEIARQIITDLIDSVSGVRVGIMEFNPIIYGYGPTYFYGQDAKGGKVAKEINSLGSPGSSARENLKNAIRAITAESGTPLAETLYEAGLYFKGSLSYFNPGVNYVSPIEYHCQKNYVIIMTDGDSTVDNDPILNTIGDKDGDGHDPGGNDPYHYLIGGIQDQFGTDYLDDVAKYLYDSDLRPDMEGQQNIITYTIGFQVDSQHQLLQRTAANGHGKYYYTQTVQSLADAFQNIVDDILTKQASFVAPTVPVSRMEREVSDDNIYLAFFKPLQDRMWSGNIKKYGLDVNGGLVDVNSQPALDSKGQFLETSRSNWSSGADGGDVEKGGVGEILLNRSTARNIYTYMSTESNLTGNSNAFTTSNTLITPTTLGLTVGDTAGKNNLIQFVQGFDSYNGRPTEKRGWILGSFLHSRPAVVYYDTTHSSVIFAGSNDGMLHAFDDTDGSELWAFIPPNLLNKLQALHSDLIQSFVDGSPKVFLNGSQKILVFGERRGGDRYIALDITDRLAPKFLWEISPSTAGFSELGQTWSVPLITKIRYGLADKWVMFIGGGYDENQDNDPVVLSDTKGRAIYVVDVVSGSLVYKYSHAENEAMDYSIPSNLSKVDVDGDGRAERLYVGDMGGRIWRIDISSSGLTGEILFNAGRKIFYPPEVTLENDSGLYETLFFGTGDREHPKENTVINRLYSVKDKSLSATLTENDLVDVTLNLVQTGSATERQQILGQLKAKNGWYIKLDQNPGEKALSQPVVFYKVAYFTTFNPVAGSVTDPCFVGEGVARLYAVDYTNASALFNFDLLNDSSGVVLNRSDRSKVIGTSIPSGAIITFRGGNAVNYIGVGGGVFTPPLKKSKNIVPISWKRVF